MCKHPEAYHSNNLLYKAARLTMGIEVDKIKCAAKARNFELLGRHQRGAMHSVRFTCASALLFYHHHHDRRHCLSYHRLESV